MDERARMFLHRLLATASPSGFEVEAQRVWVEYVSAFADEVRTDAYGNAVAVFDGGSKSIAFAGHADEIGFIVRRIDDDGFLHLGSIGGADPTVSRGQHVEVHAADGPVPGVIGQTAIHLRETDEAADDRVRDLAVDVGAVDGDEARDLVDVGDPVTFATRIQSLCGSRIAARGLDNRVGIWSAAEGLRRAVEREVEATVYAVSTVQEEVGLRGASMVGFDLELDAAIAVDVTHASDGAEEETDDRSDVSLSEGPVIGRGSTNHPVLGEAVRAAADESGISVQLEATGSGTGTDADAFYTARGGVPSLTVSVPNRYMHTPVEVVDETDLVGVADLLGAFAERASAHDDFAVSL